MKKILLSIVFFSFLVVLKVSAQTEKCGTVQEWNESKVNDPNVEKRMNELEAFTKKYVAEHLQDFPKKNTGTNNSRNQRSLIITIPVVVHVIHTGEPIGTESNISDQQVMSQIDVLNEDFRLLNSDSLPISHPFYPYTADCLIEFCLAQQDPFGNATNGITRTESSLPYFTKLQMMQGFPKIDTLSIGCGNWDPYHYLNLWTVKEEPDSGLLGVAKFPSELAAYPKGDGVVFRYDVFGRVGTLAPSYNKGRTASHEIGHWLNLRHIWGDDVCGDDSISDTPPQEASNSGCPTFPYNANNTCGSDQNGEMYMDYMDYTDDSCTVMFTAEQAMRMITTLFGPRSEIQNSIACSTPSAISTITAENNIIQVYPNPSKENVYVRINCTDRNFRTKLILRNELGAELKNISLNNTDTYKLDVSSLPCGIYFLDASVNDKRVSKKVIVAK